MSEPQQGLCISCGSFVDNEGNCVSEAHESGHRRCEFCDGGGHVEPDAYGDICLVCNGDGVVLHKSYRSYPVTMVPTADLRELQRVLLKPGVD